MATKSTSAKRGRPALSDSRNLKSRAITVCLTQSTHKQLLKAAAKQNQKPATMARILIEAGMVSNKAA